jgi:hypothetical protein
VCALLGVQYFILIGSEEILVMEEVLDGIYFEFLHNPSDQTWLPRSSRVTRNKKTSRLAGPRPA